MVTARGEEEEKMEVLKLAANGGIGIFFTRRLLQPSCGLFGEPGNANFFGINISGRARMKAQLTDVRGIGPTMASALEAQGVRTVAALAKASIDKVTAAPGFGEARAAEVIGAATNLLAAAGGPKAAAKMAASLQVKNKLMGKKSKAKKIKDKKKNGGKKKKKKNKKKNKKKK